MTIQEEIEMSLEALQDAVRRAPDAETGAVAINEIVWYVLNAFLPFSLWQDGLYARSLPPSQWTEGNDRVEMGHAMHANHVTPNFVA